MAWLKKNVLISILTLSCSFGMAQGLTYSDLTEIHRANISLVEKKLVAKNFKFIGLTNKNYSEYQYNSATSPNSKESDIEKIYISPDSHEIIYELAEEKLLPLLSDIHAKGYNLKSNHIVVDDAFLYEGDMDYMTYEFEAVDFSIVIDPVGSEGNLSITLSSN